MTALLELREDQINFIVDSAWTCPECGHDEVKLFVHPHRYSGTYECQNEDCSASWDCLHEDTTVETIEDDPMYPDQTIVYISEVTTCTLCECQVES